MGALEVTSCARRVVLLVVIASSSLAAACSSGSSGDSGPKASPSDAGATCTDDGICDIYQAEDCTCADCKGDPECIKGHTTPVVGTVKPFVGYCNDFLKPEDVFTVRNDGDATLEMTQDNVYQAASPQPVEFQPVTIAPGSTETFVGRFNVMNFKHSIDWTGDELHRFTTNDPDQPEIQVNIPVSVYGVSMTAPGDVDFGNVPVATKKSVLIQVTASGSAPGGYFWPSAVAGSNDVGFTLAASSHTELYVASGTSATIQLDFTPTSTGCVSQEFVVPSGSSSGLADNYLCQELTMTWHGCGI